VSATQEGYLVRRWGEDPTWTELPVPGAGADEVEIAVEACGIGLTVLNCINGDLSDDPALLPRVPGHELVGRVVAAGPGAGQALVGRRVVAYFYRFCGACEECTAGRQSRCRDLDGWIGVHSDGGYAPRTVLPARNAVPVAEELDPVAATIVPDAVATPVHVCGTRARLTPADRVAVIGAGGGVGAHLLQVAALFGAAVAGLDVGADKLAQVEELGARAVDSGDFGAVDPGGLWREGPPTVVVDLLGTPASLAWAGAALDVGGRLVVLTTFPGRHGELDPRALVFKEAAVLGSRYASVAEVAAAGRLVAAGRVRPVIGEVVGPDGVPAVHAALREGRLIGRGALRW
jgi:D-arabinose 1-dehydrogenase-like Zn-dependent alcohol dehydrogenase